MLKRVATYIGYGLLWLLLIVVVVCAERLVTKNEKEQLVTTTDITIEGGGSNPMINADAVSWWLKEHNAHPEGCVLEKLDIATIESVVSSHNAVDRANVSVTYDGCVEIDIEQREPVARLRITGYDMYLSRDGYMIPAEGLSPVFPGKNTGTGCQFLLQGIFLAQGSNLGLLHWQVDSLPLSHKGSPMHSSQ